jgi:hypothetical protein
MDEVIPWWRQNFIEEFSALNSNVVVENMEDANFVGGTEQDRKLVKERIQVSKIVSHPRICLAVAMAPFVTLCVLQPIAFLRILSLHR